MFIVNALSFEYYIHEYGNTLSNERKVELPLGFYALNRLRQFGPVLEVGAVSLHYVPINHTIIDLYETGDPRVTNVNAYGYNYTGKNVLSISTIEHIGREEHGHNDLVGDHYATETVYNITHTAAHWFLTMPIGFNPHLDNFLLRTRLNKLILKADSKYQWSETSDTDFSARYSHREGRAKSVCIITNLPEFLPRVRLPR